MEPTTIKLFLMDGDPSGRIKCSFSSGWNGCGYKIPASDLNKSDSIEALKSAGVYFLFGYDEEDRDIVYIGQGNTRSNGQGVLCRIKEPHNQINDWKTCVIFVADGSSNLGPTELNYLENKFTKLSQKSGRYIVKNGNTPNDAKLSEEVQADMNLFVANASIILSALGHKVLEPIVSKKEKTSIYTYSFNGLTARGLVTNDGFVLLKGSQLNGEEKFAERWKEKLPIKRQEYANKIRNNVTIEDILFKSPSGAACFCSGQSVSGPKNWFDKNRTSLEKNEKPESD